MPSGETMIQRVRERAGLAGDDEARAVLDATLAAVGGCLDRHEALALADQLPGGLAEVVRSARFAGACDEEELYRRVERNEGVGPGFAREHVQAVCEVLGEHLDAETRQVLERALPPALADLLAHPRAGTGSPEAAPGPEPVSPAEPPVVPPGYGHTHETPQAPAGAGGPLAESRPGSRHPISEANPGRGQPDSIAGTDEPYADRKLSTGHSRPRSGHTLADGKPGSDRPVSESD